MVDHAVAEQAPVEWTPVAVPKPLYLSRPVIEPVEIGDPTEALAAAAAQAEEALRSAPQPPSIPSRFAACLWFPSQAASAAAIASYSRSSSFA